MMVAFIMILDMISFHFCRQSNFAQYLFFDLPGFSMLTNGMLQSSVNLCLENVKPILKKCVPKMRLTLSTALPQNKKTIISHRQTQ